MHHGVCSVPEYVKVMSCQEGSMAAREGPHARNCTTFSNTGMLQQDCTQDNWRHAISIATWTLRGRKACASCLTNDDCAPDEAGGLTGNDAERKTSRKAAAPSSPNTAAGRDFAPH